MIEPVGGSASWRAADYADRDDWLVRLSAAEVDEILVATRESERMQVPVQEIAADNFALPRFAEVAGRALDALIDGRGFVLLRGLPVDELSTEQSERMFFGLAQYLGVAIPQIRGQMIVHVRDAGIVKEGEGRGDLRKVSGSQTRSHLDYHCDFSDIVGLLCLQTARSGGTSTIVSSVAIHDTIARERPDLVGLLYEPWWGSRTYGDGSEKLVQQRICGQHNGRFFARYARIYLEEAYKRDDTPNLTAAQREVLEMFTSLANSSEYVVNMQFRRGDLQLLNNYVTLHARTEYQDWDDPKLKRDLVRLWLVTTRDLELPADFAVGRMDPYLVASGG